MDFCNFYKFTLKAHRHPQRRKGFCDTIAGRACCMVTHKGSMFHQFLKNVVGCSLERKFCQLILWSALGVDAYLHPSAISEWLGYILTIYKNFWFSGSLEPNVTGLPQEKSYGTLGWFYGFKLHLVCNDKGQIIERLKISIFLPCFSSISTI